MFIDNEPVEGTKDIFPYVDFVSLERANYGLVKAVLKGDFTIEDTENVGEETFEPIAMRSEFRDAIGEVGEKYAFEEQPFVEVTSAEEWAEVEAAVGGEKGRTFMDFKGPGIYDFRDFSYVGTVEEYELQEMESMADQILESMFQGDEWEAARDKLMKGEEESRTEAILHGDEMATVRVGRTEDLMRVQIVMDEHDVRNIDIREGYEERALSVLEGAGVNPRKPSFLRRFSAQVLHRDLGFLSTKESKNVSLGGMLDVRD